MPVYNWEDKSYYDHSRGIVSNYDAMTIPKNAVADANNVFFRKLGSIKKRLGYTPVGSEIEASVEGVMGLHAYYGEGIKEMLAVVHQGLYYWDDPNWTNIVDTLTANKRTEFANALNKCIIVNGEDIPKKLTGLVLTDLGSGIAPNDWRPNKADFIKWRHNVLWFAKLTEKDATVESSRVRQSEIRTIEGADAYVWNWYYDSEADADIKGITGIHPFRNSLVVMKEKRTAMIVGTSREDYGIFNYDGSLGSIAHRSMQEYNDKLFYLGTKGIYGFDGVYNTKYSDAIDNIIASLNEENLYKSASIKWDNQYFIAVPSENSTYNDTIIVLDGELGSFTKLTGINASCFTHYLTGNDTYLYFGESNAGKVYQLFKGSAGDITHDAGSPISASFTTGKKFTGESNWINDVRHLWIEAKGHSSDTLTIKYRFDQNTDWLPTAGWTFNLSNRFQRFVFPEGSYGRVIQFKVENSSLLTPFEFFGFTISKRRRRVFS